MITKEIKFENANTGQDKIGLIVDDCTRFVLPLFYMDNKNTTNSEITNREKEKLKLIVKAWRKYQRKPENTVSASGDDKTEYYNFDVAISIVEDFVNNGIYIEFEKNNVYRKDGKIDFAKTIKKCKPLMTDQGSVYLTYISQIKKINDEEVIRSIQKISLNSISKEIGWLIGFNIQLPIDIGTTSITKKSLYDLNSARNTSFNTRKLMLIDLLMRYIKNTDKENSSLSTNIFAGTAHSFWEEMIIKVFGNLTKKEINKNFYVRHSYRVCSSKRVTRVMDPLMPDAIYKDDVNISVIDAKYYSEYNLPSNDDISKQFVYFAKAMRSFGEKFNYNNWFVIPTNNETRIVDLEVIFDISVDPVNEYSPIRILYANMEEVITKYVNDEYLYDWIT